MDQEALLELTADIIAAHVSHNAVAADALPGAIAIVHAALSSLGKPAEAMLEAPVPAVPIRSSVRNDTITCLECGAKLKMLRRHLTAEHELSVEDYRGRWGLKADYPLVAPEYAARRQALAVASGLGKTGTRNTKSAGQKKAAAASATAPGAANAPETADAAVPGTANAAPAPREKKRGKLGISAG